VDEILLALADQHTELAGLVDGCTTGDWERPTRCVGWDVAAIVLHLAATDELAAASARGQLTDSRAGWFGDRNDRAVSVDDAAAAQVDAERGAGGPAIRERWHDASRSMRTAFAEGDLHERVPWVSGRLSLLTLVTTRLSECWIHTGDIASALGVEIAPTDRLRPIARLAWRTLPYAFELTGTTMTGPVALDLSGPNGEEWRFDPDEPAVTVIAGSAAEFCEVAARRIEPDATHLSGTGPDADAVLRLVRTYAQ
jgi:uncharacterized protein (TIGR03084 family)